MHAYITVKEIGHPILGQLHRVSPISRCCFLHVEGGEGMRGCGGLGSVMPGLHLVTAHLHPQNQVGHALRTRDFRLSIHFPIHFAQRDEYPVTLSRNNFVRKAKYFQLYS